MKRLVTAAVAATLMCGVSAYAYAQDTQQAPSTSAPASGASGSDQSTQGGMNPAPPSDTGSAAQTPSTGGQTDTGSTGGAPAANGSMSGGAMGAGGSTTNSSSMQPPAQGAAPAEGPPAPGDNSDVSRGAAETADTPSGQPPSSYPPCTHKGEDRCVQGGHMASESTKHHHMTRTHHHAMTKKAPAASSSDNSAAPATAPASPGV